LLAGSIGISLIEDLKHQKIPNAVTFPTMALAIGYHSLSSGLGGLSFSAAGLALAIALFIVPYLLGGMGAGDVKLMGAAGAILGPQGICIVSILAVLSGGVYGMILFAMNLKYTASFLRRLWVTFKTFVLTRQLILIPLGIDEEHPVLRYAVPITMGAFGYMFMKITGYDPLLEMLAGKP
jgi:prepilin peptidase CpaA